MRDLKIAAAQFEARDADKAYNLSRIDDLTRQAVSQGAEVVSFHECCISGYTFLMTLSRQRLAELAEDVPTALPQIDSSRYPELTGSRFSPASWKSTAIGSTTLT